ncbi:MAG TPA: glutamate--cysteine ligase [Propionibacteriaceae bacterium]|nr:glutamate--cysteine ligase [Propionibacteriaceae bacterium]
MRTIGVEEELLLVDGRTGAPTAIAERLLQNWEQNTAGNGEASPPPVSTDDGVIEAELQQQQIEIDTAPCTALVDLEQQIHAWRQQADKLARTAGGRAVAIATSPLPVSPDVMPGSRHRALAERFGLTAVEQLTCGCHVHVGVESPDEGVAVIDRIRVWLPVLIALSANSPFWQGRDSGYASYRSQVWRRFPTAGPTEQFGGVAAYRGRVAALLATGVPLDEAMMYFDARLSHRYPTVEVRVADVCLLASDTVLLAGLVRALVETAVRAWKRGDAARPVPAELLRMASWRASRSGVEGELLDPYSARPRPAADVVAALVEHIGPAARDLHDEDALLAGLDQVQRRGTGTMWQRRAYKSSGSLPDMILRAADRTIEMEV